MAFALNHANSSKMLDKTSLHFAVMINSVLKIKHLLIRGADVNEKDQRGRTPLHLAGFSNESKSHFESIELLLKNGADVNSQDNYQKTPLHYLMKNG